MADKKTPDAKPASTTQPRPVPSTPSESPLPGSAPPVPPVPPESSKEPVLAPHATADKLAVNEPTSTAPNSAEILTPAQVSGDKPLQAPDREAVHELVARELDQTGPGNLPSGAPKDDLDERERVREDAPAASPPTEGSAPVPVPTTQEIEQPRPDDGPTTIANQRVHAPHVATEDVTVNDPPSTAANAGDPAPVVITKDDPLGRQPGDPNATIDLPPEPVRSGFAGNVFAGDRPMTVEEMDHANAARNAPVRRPDVVTDGIRQDPVISERTAAELQAGRMASREATDNDRTPHRAGEFAPVVPTVPEDAGIVSGAAFMGAENPDGTTKTYSQPPSITAQTRMEQEAGRAAVQRKCDDYAHGQNVMRRHAAGRLRDGAPVDAGDLNYNAPKE